MEFRGGSQQPFDNNHQPEQRIGEKQGPSILFKYKYSHWFDQYYYWKDSRKESYEQLPKFWRNHGHLELEWTKVTGSRKCLPGETVSYLLPILLHRNADQLLIRAHSDQERHLWENDFLIGFSHQEQECPAGIFGLQPVEVLWCLCRLNKNLE